MKVTYGEGGGIRAAFLLSTMAAVLCSLWTSKCCVSGTPVHRTELSRSSDPYARTRYFRDSRMTLSDSIPVFSEGDYETFRPSVLLKRSRRISRTSNRTTKGGFSSGFNKKLKSGPPQPCSHVGDGTNDIAARAYLAGAIFEGKARSRSADKGPGGMYAVTFSVQHVYKDTNPIALRLRSQVRLSFKEKIGPPPPKPCVQDYNYTGRSSEPVRANIKSGGKYLLFVSGVGPHNFSVLGEPVFRTKKNLQAVREVLCQNCERSVVVYGLRDVTVPVKGRLRLVCRCKGNPLPALQWLKNGARVNVSRSLRIQYKKKRSSLLIPRVRPEDAGRYECMAIGVKGETIVTGATVKVNAQHSRIPNENTTMYALYAGPCPISSYCLNGGTCTHYISVGELACECAEGYNGLRCETKDVNRSSMYRPMSYFCKLGISNSYYC